MDHYDNVPEDFVKHLVTTLAVVALLVVFASLAFGVPEAHPLTIKSYARKNPVAFESLVLRALDGTGHIASYGPPYNHGTGNIESPLQTTMGIWHPIDAAQDFVLKPLTMASTVNPAIAGPLHTFVHASPAQQAAWEKSYAAALTQAPERNGHLVIPPGSYGPMPALLHAALTLGQSGLMSGALIRHSAVVTRFDNQNYLLFLQGAPMHQIAKPLGLLGTQWGIIHPAVPGYPAAWWMTIPTWIYQWPFVAASPANDAIALSLGFVVWLLLALVPWIPGLNQLPRVLGVYRLIWKGFYREK